MNVEIENPSGMCLLGLLMKGLIAGRLAREALARRAAGMRGDVLVEAGGMRVTLRFEGTRIAIMAGSPGRPRASVRGDMTALLGLVTGGGLLGPLLSRRVRIGGNPLVLLGLLPLMKVERT